MDSQQTLLDSQTTVRISPTSHDTIVAMYPTPTINYKVDTIPRNRKRKTYADKETQTVQFPRLPDSDIEDSDADDIDKPLNIRKRVLKHPQAVEVQIYVKRKSLVLYEIK